MYPVSDKTDWTSKTCIQTSDEHKHFPSNMCRSLSMEKETLTAAMSNNKKVLFPEDNLFGIWD